MGNSPAISVVVPTYNRLDFLTTALKSLARQTFRDFEILVVNDAGHDVSGVVNAFSKSLNITLLTHKSNKGIAAARNTGMTASQGTYIAHLDDDDYYFPEHLAVLHDFLSTSQYKVAYTFAREDIQYLRNGATRTVAGKLTRAHNFSRPDLYQFNLTPTLCVMHERACLSRAGLCAEYLKAHEDWDLWLRMSRYYDFACIPQVTCAYTTRLNQASLSKNEKLMAKTWVFVRVQGVFAGQTPPVCSLEQAAQEPPANFGPDHPAPCAASIVVPIASVDKTTLQSLASLCAVAGDAQIVLVGSGVDEDAFAPLYSSLAAILPRPPLGLCYAKDIGRILAANRGAAAATGEWLIFLEVEVQPQPGWLDAMLEAAKNTPKIGALSGLLFTAGIAPIAGGVMDDTGAPMFVSVAEDGATTMFYPAPLVSGHCFMIGRETFADFDGFDAAFAPAHFADADLCLRLAQKGLICGIAPTAQLFWNKTHPAPLQQCASGILSLRLIRDRWAAQAQFDKICTKGVSWSLRTSLWPSDGEMPKSCKS